MMVLSEVIQRLGCMLEQYGDIEVKIVNYHSDYRDNSVDNIDDAVIYIEGDNYVRIGGEYF